jgi:uncharacterized protein YndB with AHSA1/START domain
MSASRSAVEVHASVEIAAPAAAVFAALTDPARLGVWWGSADMYRTRNWVMELKAGGSWACEVDESTLGSQRAYGQIVEVDPPRLLVWTWNTTWDGSGATTIRYDLAPTPTGTRLEVRHSGFSASEHAKGYEIGWPIVLGWLMTQDAELRAEISGS